MTKKWMSSKPVVCDLCKKPLKRVFIDGRTSFGSWAIMCPVCHTEHGGLLGLGSGQMYNAETLEKIGG